MNIDRFSRLLNRCALVVSLLLASFTLVACGGGSSGDSRSSSSNSSVSSSFSSSSSSSSVEVEWPGINVTSTEPRTLTFYWTEVAGATHYKLFKNVDGSSGYVQVGEDLTDTMATDLVSVHLHDWVNALYLIEACNETDCEESTPVTASSAMLAAIGYVKASNTEANDWFGWSVALSADGSTLAVGAPAEDSKATGVDGDQSDNTSPSSGAVYVFTQVDGLWAQEAYIKASNTEQPNEDETQTLPNDRFGYRVALSTDGSRLVVSSLLEDSSARGVNCDQGNLLYMDGSDNNKIKHGNVNVGAVYVFTRSAGEWAQEAYLKASNAWPEDRFGFSLAVAGDGNTIAIGTIDESVNLSGVFAPASASASSVCAPANTVPSSAASSSSSVSSSSISSISSVAASSVSSGSNSSVSPVAAKSGAVYVFVREEGVWSQKVYIKASNTNAGDAFGASVALSDDGATLAVGAPGEDSSATGINGDQTSNTIKIGEREYSSPEIGAVYVFRRVENVWTQQAYVKPGHVTLEQQFGASVSLSGDGNRLAVGAIGDLSKAQGVGGNPADYDILEEDIARQSGAAYVFTYSGTAWAQDVYIKASNAETGDQFGRVVRLSSDGMTLAVGTNTEQSLASGINGNEADNSGGTAGAVYVFTLSDSVWVQQSYVKPSYTRGGDRFGTAIGLSADGGTMAVGGYREPSAATGINGDRGNSSAPSAGAVHLY